MQGNNYSLENLASVVIITGDDYFLVKEERDSIISLLPSGSNDIDFVIYKDEDRLSDILFDCNNLAFMSVKRIICLDRTEALNKEDRDAFNAYLKNPSSSSVLLIIDNNKAFRNYYKKAFTIEKNRLNFAETSERIIMTAKESSVTIDNDAVSLLIEYTDRYMFRIDIELRKLIAYAMDKNRITAEDVKECVRPETDYQIYQFINAAIRGDAKTAILFSENLLESGTPNIVLLSSMINQYRKLLYLSLNYKSKSESELAALFNAPLFTIHKDKAVAKGYSQRKLKSILDMLYDMEYSFKSGKMTEETALKTAIAYVLVEGGR